MTEISCNHVRFNRLLSMCGLLYLLTFLFVPFSSLQAEPAFQFHTLDKQQGLASSVVYDIAEDGDGFIWFATEDGLQKYDGFEFTNYRHSRLDEHSLSSNIVRNLLVDSEGRLWLGTDNGVNLYQREFDNFKRIEASDVGLPSNKIRALYQSSDGYLWIGTANGLSRLDIDSYEIENYSQEKVRTIFEDDHHQLWVGTLGKGVFQFDQVNKQFLPIRNKQIKLNATKQTIQLSEQLIIDIFQDSFGRILVATWGNGVFLLDKDNRKLSEYKLDLPSNKVRTILQDKQGRIWYGTQHGILIRNDLKAKNMVVKSDKNDLISPSSDNIFKIFQSSDETIWMGTYGGGVSRHSPSSRIFESYGVQNDRKYGLVDSVVFSMSENPDGNIWIGTEQGMLSLFLPASKTFRHYPLKLNKKLFDGAITAVFQAAEDLVLVGTDVGLYKFEIKENVFTKFLDSKGKHIKNADGIRFIEPDLNGNIWVGYNSSGIQALRHGRSINSKLREGVMLDISSPQALLNISKSHFMVGTQGEGILNVYFSDEKIKISKLPDTMNINFLHLTKGLDGKIWAASWSGGIKIYSDNKLVKSLDEDDGLPNNTVYTILTDPISKKMWATTNEGMVSVDPETYKLHRYGFHDGLQGDEFNRPGLVSGNGYFYFGGMNGFNRFFPNIIESKLFVSKPKIIGLSIANKEVKVSQKGMGALKRSILVSSKIDLQYGQTPFSIQFTSPQFVKPSDIEFRYRLIGLSDKWIAAASNSRNATYTNISAGDYVFELQVRDVNTRWSARSITKRITVHPPWWLTSIAKVCYWLSALTIMSFIFYLNWKRRQAEVRTQKTIEESEKRLRLSLWGGGNETWDWDINSGQVLRSNAEENISINCTNLSRNFKELSSYIHKYDLDRVKIELNSHLSGKTEFFESAYRIKDEKLGWRWIQDRAKVVEKDDNNKPVRMSGTQSDISEMHRKDEEIERLGQAFKTTSDGVWIRDAKWRMIECNPSYERITGFSFEEKKGEELWFPNVPEQSVNIFQRIRLSILEKGNWQGEVWAERNDADPFPQKLTVDTILDEKGYIRYYVGVFSDITFHKRAEEEFRKLANFDALTGLPNRACLYDRLGQTIEKTRIRKERFVIFVIDIDNFKRVNDSLGHAVGDILITEVARRLTSCNRDGDTIARVGGDEFVIMRNDIQSTTEVASFAELMLSELNLPVYIKGQKLNLNFSIGIAISPDDGLTAERLLRNADTAMYEAKKEVLNSYHFYSIELNDRARKKLAMENELRFAIENHEIYLVYQPKVDLNTGRIYGMEALARWHHPKFGEVSPDEFIQLAEETGQIPSLGKQLLRKAVIQTKKWVESGVMRGKMSVNLSAHQFWEGDLVSDVASVLAHEGLDAEYLELELTETACVKDIDQAIAQMNELRDLGVDLALDDFGTGYSSLAQLKTLPLTTLKVDKSFIHNVHLNKQDGNIVKAIIDIANSLELNVVIEGVESQQQCEYLWQCRARIIQGFFFSKPVTAEEMDSLFAKHWEQKYYLKHVGKNISNFLGSH